MKPEDAKTLSDWQMVAVAYIERSRDLAKTIGELEFQLATANAKLNVAANFRADERSQRERAEASRDDLNTKLTQLETVALEQAFEAESEAGRLREAISRLVDLGNEIMSLSDGPSETNATTEKAARYDALTGQWHALAIAQTPTASAPTLPDAQPDTPAPTRPADQSAPESQSASDASPAASP